MDSQIGVSVLLRREERVRVVIVGGPVRVPGDAEEEEEEEDEGEEGVGTGGTGLTNSGIEG